MADADLGHIYQGPISSRSSLHQFFFVNSMPKSPTSEKRVIREHSGPNTSPGGVSRYFGRDEP
jgi:hypothetical protein